MSKLPKLGCKIFISMCSGLACLALLSQKVNKLLCNILVTLSPKTTKNQVTKMVWKAHKWNNIQYTNKSQSYAYSMNLFTFFDQPQYFLNMVKLFKCSSMPIYKVNYHFWPCSKFFDHLEKLLNIAKKIWTWSKSFWTGRWIRQ